MVTAHPTVVGQTRNRPARNVFVDGSGAFKLWAAITVITLA